MIQNPVVQSGGGGSTGQVTIKNNGWTLDVRVIDVGETPYVVKNFPNGSELTVGYGSILIVQGGITPASISPASSYESLGYVPTTGIGYELTGDATLTAGGEIGS